MTTLAYLPIAEQQKKIKKNHFQNLLSSLMMTGLLIAYHITGAQWLFNIFAFISVFYSVLALIILVITTLLVSKMIKVVNSQSINESERLDLNAEIYTLFRNINLASRNKIYIVCNLLLAGAIITYLVITGHFLISALLLIMVALSILIRYVGNSFTPDDVIEEYLTAKHLGKS